ncbi:hypothetical protein IJT17_08795 [bacterium]|nr:hypothetical protein [bacterium]
MKTALYAFLLGTLALGGGAWGYYRHIKGQILDGPGMVCRVAVEAVFYTETPDGQGTSINIEARRRQDDSHQRIDLRISKKDSSANSEENIEYMAKDRLFQDITRVIVNKHLAQAAERPHSEPAEAGGIQRQLTVEFVGRPAFTLDSRQLTEDELEGFDSIADKLQFHGYRWWPQR